jgi:hypothetical protein
VVRASALSLKSLLGYHGPRTTGRCTHAQSGMRVPTTLVGTNLCARELLTEFKKHDGLKRLVGAPSHVEGAVPRRRGVHFFRFSKPLYIP